MWKKVLLFIFVLLLIGASIYIFTNKKDAKKIIDESIAKEAIETIDIPVEGDNEDKTKQKEEDEDQKDQSDTDGLKDLLVDTVKQTVDFFLKKDIYITAIGDSLTQGVGDETENGGYIGILDRTINHEKDVVTFDNFGRNGNRTDQLLERLNEQEIASSIKKSDMVLITIGANDIMQVVKENFTNITYPKFAKAQVLFEVRLDKIFDEIKKLNPDTHIYLLGFYNPFEKYFPNVTELGRIVDEWNETGEKTVNEYENTTFIPIKDLFIDSDVDLFSEDHFHPNYTGYKRMAERVIEYLTEEER